MLLTESSLDHLLLEDVSRIVFDSVLIQHPEEPLLESFRSVRKGSPKGPLDSVQVDVLAFLSADVIGYYFSQLRISQNHRVAEDCRS